ncbi:hypothetical protein JQS43_22995 [Natronosporangium hydrolyticum]|uniref:Uncharacterized protein n=1 Tax=Natronosporangium hydrolyticum TaxID=2811111 RepID=A0A895YJP1_9ACTN|nr:hypothetical protein [Natronosporangium hydrolyticum]QSB14330.1 hypothetical protein JQS43_22995 [Natronosporangium hydrolyticum]
MTDEVGVEPDHVYTAGQHVARFATDASGLAGLYASRLDTAAATVHHQTVAIAVGRYREQWRPFARDIADDVDALGQNTSSVAVVITEADHDASALLAQSTATADSQQSVLTRPISSHSAAI